MKAAIDKLRAYLHTRQFAYRRVFTGPYGDVVLSDLAHFCRAQQSTFHADPRIAAMLDGRREVWLRIMDHLNLSPEDLFALSTGQAGANTSEVRQVEPGENNA